MSTALTSEIPAEAAAQSLVRIVRAEPLPDSPVDTFSRHGKISGHKPDALKRRFGLVGAGGIGGFTALGLLRSGASNLIIFDGDLVDRTNLPRQLFFAE